MADAAAFREPGPPLRQAAFGLAVDCDYALPGAGAIAPGTSDGAVLTIGTGPARLVGSAEAYGPYRRRQGQLELTIPDAGRFLLAGPGRLEVAARPDVGPEVVGAFLVASGLPMLLWQRGGLLLHATGLVLPNDTAIALAGPTGVGKSTLAHCLIGQGARLIGDDTLWLPDPDGTALACGLNGGQFLRQPGGGVPVFHDLAREQRAGAAPLSGLVILSCDDAGALPERLTPLAAVQALLNVRHRPRVPALLGREGEVLALCTQLAGALPVYRLGRRDRAVTETAAAIAVLGEGLAR